MEFWIGYAIGVSQNVVAAFILAPIAWRKVKAHLASHHYEIIGEFRKRIPHHND